jgi:hypothetical protein
VKKIVSRKSKKSEVCKRPLWATVFTSPANNSKWLEQADPTSVVHRDEAWKAVTAGAIRQTWAFPGLHACKVPSTSGLSYMIHAASIARHVSDAAR